MLYPDVPALLEAKNKEIQDALRRGASPVRGLAGLGKGAEDLEQPQIAVAVYRFLIDHYGVQAESAVERLGVAPDEEFYNEWEHTSRSVSLRLEPVDDPNLGIPMKSDPEWLSSLDLDSLGDELTQEGYVPLWSDLGRKLGLVDRFHGTVGHFGGTSEAVNDEPDNWGPFYLEWDEDLGGNLGGGGVAQLDLKQNQLEWSC